MTTTTSASPAAPAKRPRKPRAVASHNPATAQALANALLAAAGAGTAVQGGAV